MERETSLQVRMSEDEKLLAKQLADEYGLKGGASEMVRLALKYISEKRPALTVTILPAKKVLAPRVVLN